MARTLATASSAACQYLLPESLREFRESFPSYSLSIAPGDSPAVAERLAQYVDDWAGLGVRAWAKGWWEMPVTVGNEIAPLIGAGAGEYVRCRTYRLGFKKKPPGGGFGF